MARRNDIVFEDEIHQSAWAWLLTGLGLGVLLITVAYLFVQVRDEHLSFRFLADLFTQEQGEKEKQTAMHRIEKYRQENIPLNYHELLTQKGGMGDTLKSKPVPAKPVVKPQVVESQTVQKTIPKAETRTLRVPETKAQVAKVKAPAAKPVSQRSTGVKPYVVQAGSFTQFTQADQLKARLAMNGYYATIQKARVNNRAYYRVRLGPFANKAKAQVVRQELASININAMAMSN